MESVENVDRSIVIRITDVGEGSTAHDIWSQVEKVVGGATYFPSQPTDRSLDVGLLTLGANAIAAAVASVALYFQIRDRQKPDAAGGAAGETLTRIASEWDPGSEANEIASDVVRQIDEMVSSLGTTAESRIVVRGELLVLVEWDSEVLVVSASASDSAPMAEEDRLPGG